MIFPSFNTCELLQEHAISNNDVLIVNIQLDNVSFKNNYLVENCSDGPVNLAQRNLFKYLWQYFKPRRLKSVQYGLTRHYLREKIITVHWPIIKLIGKFQVILPYKLLAT